MNFKKALAWFLVIIVGYVVLYSYIHPDEMKYQKPNPFDEGTQNHILYDVQWGDSDLPFVPEVKNKNPFVYYMLKIQGWLIVIGLLWWLFDYKNSKKQLQKFGKIVKKHAD